MKSNLTHFAAACKNKKQDFDIPLRSCVVWLIFYLLFITNNTVTAQCFSIAPHDANTFVNDASYGTIAFTDPAYAQWSDANRATVSVTPTELTGTTNYLKATNFGFFIPSSSSICGVVVEIEKSASGINFQTSVTDDIVKIVKGGLAVGNNAALGGNWPPTDTYFSYGSYNNLWGTSFTPADINAPNFGIIIAANINGVTNMLPSALINHIRVFVYFSMSTLPVQLSAFDIVKKNEQQLNVTWTLQNEDEVTKYSIEDSSGFTSGWQPVYQTTPVNNGPPANYRAVLELQPARHFYRLHIHTRNGMDKFSNIRMIEAHTATEQYTVYTNRIARELQIGNVAAYSDAIVISMEGVVLAKKTISPGIINRFNISNLPHGIYILKIGKFTYKFFLG